MRKRKGIALQTLAGFLLATIGISVMLGIYTGIFEGGFESLFCSVYGSVISAMPGDQNIPSQCEGGGDREPEFEVLRADNSDEAKLGLISEISECWRTFEGTLLEDELCIGLNMDDWDGDTINEGSLTNELEEQGICDNVLDCEDNLMVDGEIHPGDTVFMNYNFTVVEGEDNVENLVIR